jgi:hypothetical protein
MINIKTNIPSLDKENESLIRAAALLESIGNHPNPSANEFYEQLMESQLPVEEHEYVTLAAISIETMMALDLQYDEEEEPTVH